MEKSHEKLTPEAPSPIEGTGWEDLEKLGEAGFSAHEQASPRATEQTVKPDTVSESFPEDVSPKLDRLGSANQFESSHATESTIIAPQDSAQRQAKISRAAMNVRAAYAAAERQRVDRIKANILSTNVPIYEKSQISTEPSTLKKTLRLLADKLGIKTKRSEGQREREAIHVALSEYKQEKEAAAQEEEARRAAEEAQHKAEKARQEAEWQESEARREREAIASEMSELRSLADHDKKRRFQTQRTQEILERDLNSRLLKVEDLEIEALSENPEVQKRSVEFEGVEIPVYDLKGLPFSMLSTTIDYRRFDEPGHIGTETSQTVMEDPSVWVARRDEAEHADGFGTRKANARGDTISTSYYNSESNIDSRVSGDLIYGFERVASDSIISIHNGDGNTSNMAGTDEPTLSGYNKWQELESAGGTSGYNEILLRRYSDSGAPKQPDYIITEDGHITEAALRHAKFYGIPIVNIEKSIYDEKARRRGEELLDSLSEHDSYQDLATNLDKLDSMSQYKYRIPLLDGVGRAVDIPNAIKVDAATGRDYLALAKMELQKRLDFIKTSLESATAALETAPAGTLPNPQGLPQFDLFEVSLDDAQHGILHKESGNSVAEYLSRPGHCNRIQCIFQLKGSPRKVLTNIYDGERVLNADGDLISPNSWHDLNRADSSYYDALEPLVLRYLEALQKQTATH